MSYYTNPGTPLLGGGGAIMYNSISAPDTIGPSYPDPTYYTTLGPVYLPRIYGSNLSTLEVGSSGTISYTLYDVHSLDMTRNSITNTVAMNTPTATDSFQINVANCNMSMTMDAKSNNVNIYGSNSVNLSSSNQINLVATNLNINTKNNLIFGASGGSFNANANSCNLVFNLDSNTNSASLSATCNINLLASNNLYERANSNVTISAGQAVSITAVASNLVLNGAGNTGSFTMNALDRSAYWYSASNITVGASNNMYETVGQSFAVSATGGANTLLFDNYTLNATMSTRSNMALNASNAMTVNAANSFYKLTAFAGSNLQQMDGVGITQSTQGSFYVNSSNDFVGSVSSNITLVASNTNFSATAGKKVLITAQADLYRLSAYLGSNVQQLDQVGTTQNTLGSFFINSSNDFISSVTSNIKLVASNNNFVATAGKQVLVTAQNDLYRLSAYLGSNVQQLDQVGTTQSTLGSFFINSSNDFISSVTSNIKLVASNNNFVATAGKQVLVTAQNDLYRLSAYLGSNVQQLDQVGTTQSTLGSFFINSSNDFISSVTSNIKLVASNNNFVATAGKQVLVTAQNDLYRLSAYLGSNVQQLDQVGTSQSTQGSFFVNSSNDYVASVSSNIKLVASNTNFVATAGKQVLVTAQNDLYRLSAFYASNVEQMDGVGITQSTQGSFFVNSSNDFVASVSSNIKLVASNTNFVATAGKQVLVTAQNDLYRLSAFYASNVEQMDGVGITQSTKGSFFVNSSNDWVGSVSSNITFVASNTNFSASAGKKVLINAQTDMYRLSAYIGSNVQQLDNVGTTQNTLGSFFVNSSNDFVTSVTSNIKLVASNTDFTVIAGQKINLVASNNSFSVNATGGSNTFVMDNATSSATWSSKNNIFVNSSNVMSSVATYGFNSTTTGGGFLVAAQNNVWMTSSNAAVVLTANTGVNYSKMSMDNTGVLLTTTKNATFTTPTGFSLTTSTGTGAVTLARNNNADSFALDTAGNADLNVENNVNSIAGQNQNIAATAGSVNVSAAGSNMTYTMNQASTTIAQVAGTSVVSGAYTRTTWGNETAYTATSVTYNAGLNMTYAASNNTLVTANSGSTKINMNSSPHVDDISTQSTSFNMYCTNNTIFSATSNTVIINGNLQVAGVIDSINVTQSSLLVENKMIYLAYSSNTQVSDDLVGQAGIVVEGMGLKTLAIPTAASNIAAFEKSVKWNNGSAGMYINNTAAAESFWEVKGGGVRITSSCAQLDNATQSYITASNPISFGFRINTSSGELEIYKMYIPSGQSTTTTTTVAKFGRVIIH